MNFWRTTIKVIGACYPVFILANFAANSFEKPDDKAVVYYADGVHPAHNSRSTCAWIENEQPTASGRDRVNIKGLVNAE